jgi:hypothetical protein
MTRVSDRAIGAGIRAWTWLYTAPLDAIDRDRRRREIASDLWELEHDCGGSAAFAAVARAILGAPDDLLWTCERLVARTHAVGWSIVTRIAIIAVAAATVVVSASGPAVDPARALRVNVAAAGWIAAAGAHDASGAAFAPAIAFTLTNVGDRATAALDVNAVFHRARDTGRTLGLGTAFVSIVGWRGLRPGATSAPVLLGGDGLYQIDARTARHIAIPLQRIDAARVRLFAHHEGRWTLLGDFPVPVQPISR